MSAPTAYRGTPQRVIARHLVPMLLLTASLAALTHQTSFAYVYPEHRRIMAVAIGSLDSTHSARLTALWAEARTGAESRFSPLPVDTLFGPGATTIDLAAWPAISGDHSCSAAELLQTVLTADWITGVHRVAARLEQQLAEAGLEKYRRTNALRDSDIKLLAVDHAYATRAGSNAAHFLLPRRSAGTGLSAYLAASLDPGAAMNATAIYAWHHARALASARRLASGGLPPAERRALIRSMLADEAFALHFLEDMYASGHVAGSWGDASLRKGTHDHYNEEGLAITTWAGDSYVILGDAWMREEETGHASRSVRLSLEQILGAVVDPYPPGAPPDTLALLPCAFSVCAHDSVPPLAIPEPDLHRIAAVLLHTPIPGLSHGFGELPRFRAELGPFVGVSTALLSAWHRGGFLSGETGDGFIGGIELAIRFGLGLDGVMNESGDGLTFVDIGIVRSAASTLKIGEGPEFNEFGAITAAIPARSSYFVRIRAPFWLLPFDMLLAAPILGLTAPETFTQMAAIAANGGLLGWQSGIATSAGRFQFILGREVSFHFHGWNRDASRTLAFITTPAGFTDLGLAEVHSLQIIFPVIDFRNFRIFTDTQSSGFHIQLFTGVDIPGRVTLIEPTEGNLPNARPIWFVGIRASLDWRYYF